MPAVVRVKRKIDEEPLSAFVLNGIKRQRMGENDNAASGETELTDLANLAAAEPQKDEISTILKFAGTINKQDNTATTQYARLTKEAAKELVQEKMRKPTNATEKARQEMRASLHENRFRVVNCMRTTLNDGDEESAAAPSSSSSGTKSNEEVTIIDIEKQSDSNANTPTQTAIAASDIAGFSNLTPTSQQQAQNDEAGYVYDLYLPENEQQAVNVDLMDDHYLRVRAFDDLIYEDRFTSDSDNDECDTEDSNREDNSGNDYPDEEDDYELNADHETEEGDTFDMRTAVENFMFDDDDDEEYGGAADQSSEDEDYNTYQDPYIHTTNANDESFIDDVDYCDVNRYGMAYARYKATRLKALKKKEASDGVIDENDSDS